jgi:outer membrane lipoprotein-sorting protein
MPSHLRLALPGTALLALLAPVAHVGAETVDQVIARYLQARGGLERIRLVQSLRFTGKMTLGDVQTPMVLELKRPNRMRTEFEVQGRKGVRAFDGQRGWAILPVPGLDRPRLMPDDEAKEAREQADVDLSPLVDSVAKGYQVELLGREKLETRDAWKLLVRGPDGSERTLFLDVRSSLAVRSEEKRMLEGQPREFVTLISDYRPVAGLVFPHAIELGPRGSTDRQRLTFERIEVNPVLDDARFVMPAANAAGR